MCFSRSRHTVREARRIETLPNLIKQRPQRFIKHFHIRLFLVENSMKSKRSVSDAKMVVHKITVNDPEQVLSLWAKTLNYWVTLAKVLWYMVLFFLEQWAYADTDSEWSVVFKIDSNCRARCYRGASWSGATVLSTGLVFYYRMLRRERRLMSACLPHWWANEAISFGELGCRFSDWWRVSFWRIGW